jgi:hypothetical protein
MSLARALLILDKDTLREALAISRRLLDLACEKGQLRPITCIRARAALRVLDALVQRDAILVDELHPETIRLEDVHHG